MKNNDLVLGIDTSNYTTSAALTSKEGEILLDLRKPLQVKQGERGLRQSHALFQHLENLPELLGTILDSPERDRIVAVSVSEKPRPVEGSYMPVFNAGIHFGSVVAKSLRAPFFRFSHQEGHLAAAMHGTTLGPSDSCFAWHLSGGTCELLLVKEKQISIIGGSKDISFGQLIDRIGVAMGQPFPCGGELDRRAQRSTAALEHVGNPLKPIPADGLFFNVSGIETQAQRRIADKEDGEALAFFLFQRIGECLAQITLRASAQTDSELPVLFTGGVSASEFLRTFLQKALYAAAVNPVLGKAALSSDNAVGVSLLGGHALWP